MYLNMNIKLKAKDIMTTNLIKVDSNKILVEVFEELSKKKRREVFIIETKDDGTEDIKGILTLNNIVELLQKGIPLNESINKFMSFPVYTFPPEKPATEARNFMIEKGIGRLPIWDGQKIIGLIDSVTLRDVFYKQTEELSIQLREIIDQLHQGVCVVDDQGIVILWNKSAERIYQVSAEELLGKRLKDYFPTALLDEVLNGKKSIEYVSHSPRENTYVAISAKPIWYNDNLVGAVSSEIDITEATQLFRKLEEANERVEFLETEYKKISEDHYEMGTIIGKSKKYTDAIILAKQVSKANVNVLITGESGTGKEVLARAIHLDSGRKGDFIAINCSAIPCNLLESELFGYDAGAFTGALTKGKKGKFQLADKGTLFLDEIGEMPMDMQVKLLRVLQDGVVQPVGGEKSIKTCARIIAATNKNLEKLMESGLFREDLYYRLKVITIHVPPLRERKIDIPILINSFLNEFSVMHSKSAINISSEILKILIDYDWKGNVRELKNTIERLVVLSNGKSVTIDMLPDDIIKSTLEKNTDDKPKEYDLVKTLENTEKNMIKDVMNLAQGNKKNAAQILNIPRSTLYYKLNYYQLD